EGFRPLVESVATGEPAYAARVGPIDVRGFLAWDTSPNDPYVSVQSSMPTDVVVVVNMVHPHITQLVGSEGVLNYLRHCTYDAIAEWQARRQHAQLDPNTIKVLK